MTDSTGAEDTLRQVLITGASGFIGRYVVGFFEASGISVRTMSRRSLRREQHYVGDVVDDFAPLAANCQCIVHLAGMADASSSYDQPLDFARVNVAGVLNALEAARKNQASLVFASSQRVYHPTARPLAEDAALNPVDPYGLSKLNAERWCEMYARLYGVRVTILRLFSVYGPGQAVGKSSGVVGIFFRTARDGQPLRVRARQLRDFIDVRDVARAFALAAQHRPDPVSIFNIGTGRATSIAELGDLVREVVGSSTPTILDLSPGAESYVADTKRAQTELGFDSQIDLADGLVWYNQHDAG